MSESYRRLCQDLPPPVGGAVRVPADPKKVKAWVAGTGRSHCQVRMRSSRPSIDAA